MWQPSPGAALRTLLALHAEARMPMLSAYAADEHSTSRPIVLSGPVWLWSCPDIARWALDRNRGRSFAGQPGTLPGMQAGVSAQGTKQYRALRG